MARKTRTTRKPATRMDQAVKAIGTAQVAARKAVDSLVKQARASDVAKATVAKANEVRNLAMAKAGEARARTLDTVSHLERVFETRVQKAIARLGVPSAKDVRALSRQVAQLQANVDSLRRSRARRAA